MVHARYSALYERPKPFDCVRMNITQHVDASTVIDTAMLVSFVIQAIIRSVFISEYNRLRQNALFGDAVKSGLRRIGGYGRNHAACADSALYHADNALLIGIAWRWAATLRSTLALCTEIAFVHLY